ncbi:MAG: 2-succinyl-5-enolpyruvyl-6-hydroxy-3-cyclohexene-1-carboxylic-acid synthase [Gemmatimonadaceae bacterium]
MTLPLAPDAAAFACVGAFVDELARSGVRHVCIAPGSRSTPLALTIARHPALRSWVHLDERSAGFFALGLARGLDEPVALLCTSGTAVANFLPAVVEARSAGVPLLVLTADRPAELREVGAAQTIDQHRLFGAHAKWFVEVGIPEATPELLRHVRTLACRVVALAAAAPAGPVHLNFPFREPLVPVPVEPPPDLDEYALLAWRGRADGAPWVRVDDAPPVATREVVRRLASELRSARRPLLIGGPQHDPDLAAPLARLAQAIGAPLLADPLSQLRWGSHDRGTIIDAYDAALRDETTAGALTPDVVVRIGALPTSKPLLQYLERHAAARHVVVDATRWPDPALLAAEMLHADPRWLAESLHDAIGEDGAGDAAARPWLRRWRAVDAAAREALEAHVAAVGEPFEGGALAEVAARIPSGGTLFVSSSMPVRDLDAFARGDARSLRVLANRGANGIDGVVSSALGAAAACRERGEGPLVLVIGDIAMYHDMNGLLAAKRHALDATIVVLNNDGGGIFSFLPQAEHPEHFEQLFGTPHGIDFAPVAALYGARYHRVGSRQALGEAVAAATSTRGLQLIELRTERERNVALHRAAWEAVRVAIAARPGGGG